jgi:hypothetical protein
MNLSQAIADIESAEDLYSLLDVAFDPAVMAVHRIAILKRFGQAIDVLERRRPPLSDDERPGLYAAALQRVNDLCARGGSEVEPFLRPRPRDVVSADRLRRAVGNMTTNARAEPASFAGSEASREGLGTLPGFPCR